MHAFQALCRVAFWRGNPVTSCQVLQGGCCDCEYTHGMHGGDLTRISHRLLECCPKDSLWSVRSRIVVCRSCMQCALAQMPHLSNCMLHNLTNMCYISNIIYNGRSWMYIMTCHCKIVMISQLAQTNSKGNHRLPQNMLQACRERMTIFWAAVLCLLNKVRPSSPKPFVAHNAYCASTPVALMLLPAAQHTQGLTPFIQKQSWRR